MAYFDRLENSTSAISTRLSSDAQAVQQTMGTLLGIICEALAMIIVGLVIGLLFNYQLTLIVAIPLIIISVVVYSDVRLKRRVFEESGSCIERASGVRLLI